MQIEKKEELQKEYSGYFLEKEELNSSTYSKAVILPQKDNGIFLHGMGGVIDQNGEFLQSSGLVNQFGGAYPFGEIKQTIDEKVCYCGYLINHWGHFLIDVVSRLWYALEHDDEIDHYVFVGEENSDRKPTGNYLEFLSLLGIENKIWIINTPTRFREVVVPEISFAKGRYYNTKYNSIFDKVVSTTLGNNELEKNWPEKVYFSRNHFRGKSVESGLDFVDHFFHKNGFTIIYPEEISLSEMILLLQNAKICAAESGTLTHNFLFAQKGKEVIIIERQVTINVYQCNVDIIKALNVTYVDANYEIYTTSSSYGPYFLGYTACFQRFAEEKGLIPPDRYYISEKYLKKCLRQYIKSCDNEYGYARQHGAWQYYQRHAIFEAYEEALDKFRSYLFKRKPLFWYHYFQWRFMKSAIKRTLRKIKILKRLGLE
ncbi:MAG: glycosyltransferase family 61 protein [Aeriscardovia sp.]|nr:glycosyltransferase family 61 protein [Aeriscardovia sp.]